MTATIENQFKCEKCKELREIHLHLHELALFSEYLLNERDVPRRKESISKNKTTASTKTIAKWLTLASQLERAKLNPFRYEMSHLYCEPIGDMLDSNARHHESIVTPLTRFMYVSNALEECYRFVNLIYKANYEALPVQPKKVEYLRSYSAQAAYLLGGAQNRISPPKHYDHLVDNFLKNIKFYVVVFKADFDVDLEAPEGLDYGIGLVRNVRNQIAHGAFPIIEDPEYTHEFYEPYTKVCMINLLNQASRIAAINIQMFLALFFTDFKSAEYENMCMDENYGEHFKKNCNSTYLLSLHLQQEFGLNETDFFSFEPEIDS